MRSILALAAVAAGLAAPLQAQGSSIPTTGTRIALLAAPATFPAETAFYITQGFTCESARLGCLSGLTHFGLYLGGQDVSSATDLTFGDDGALLSKFNLTNFPTGLAAGRHTFRGEWFYLGELVSTQTVAIDFV
jgi:hypothetical protein